MKNISTLAEILKHRKMTTWHQVKVKFTKEFPDGTLKKVTEMYLVNAGSFSEAEDRIYAEVGEFIRGEFIIKNIDKCDFADIFAYEDCETYFKAKVSYTTESDSGKEKKVSHSFLVTAKDIEQANERIQNSLKGLMSTFEVQRIEASPIVEVLVKQEEAQTA